MNNNFVENCPIKIAQLISENPLGALSVNGDFYPEEAFLPFLLSQRNNKSFLISHLAANNPICKLLLSSNSYGSVVFNGIDHYISPRWYEEKSLVPTWNYTKVIAKCSIRLLTEKSDIRYCVQSLTDIFEKDQSWLEDLTASRLDAMYSAIYGIECEVHEIYGVYKLSQNRSALSKKRLAHQLMSQNNDNAREMAKQINENSSEIVPAL